MKCAMHDTVGLSLRQQVSHWQDALREAVSPNGQLIVNLIPELEFVIGKQQDVPDLAPQDAQSRFQLVFRRFLGAFARPEASAAQTPRTAIVTPLALRQLNASMPSRAPTIMVCKGRVERARLARAAVV